MATQCRALIQSMKYGWVRCLSWAPFTHIHRNENAWCEPGAEEGWAED